MFMSNTLLVMAKHLKRNPTFKQTENFPLRPKFEMFQYSDWVPGLVGDGYKLFKADSSQFNRILLTGEVRVHLSVHSGTLSAGHVEINTDFILIS